MDTVGSFVATTVTSDRRVCHRIGHTRGTGTIWEENVFPEIELFGQKRIAMLGPLHVLVHLRDRQIKVEILTQDGPGEENDEDRKSGVFKIGHLNFHWPEFYSPTDRRPSRGWFESDGLPIGRLYILIDGLFSVRLEYDRQTLPTSK